MLIGDECNVILLTTADITVTGRANVIGCLIGSAIVVCNSASLV